MILPLLLAAQAAPPPIAPEGGDALNRPPTLRNGQPYPPVDMVDFLGRRLLCARLVELSSDPPGQQERLRCAALPGEEQALRVRHTGDRMALRWLDQDPLAFRLPRADRDRARRPVDIWPERMEQSGTNAVTRQPYRITIDTRVSGGRATRIIATFDGLPARSFTLDNRAFPRLDLQSLTTMLLTPRRDGARLLMLFLRYGDPRGYCGEEDDRPSVQVSFGSGRASGAYSPRVNCEHDRVPIADAAAR